MYTLQPHYDTLCFYMPSDSQLCCVTGSKDFHLHQKTVKSSQVIQLMKNKSHCLPKYTSQALCLGKEGKELGNEQYPLPRKSDLSSNPGYPLVFPNTLFLGLKNVSVLQLLLLLRSDLMLAQAVVDITTIHQDQHILYLSKFYLHRPYNYSKSLLFYF